MITRLAITLVANAVALWAAHTLVDGFSLSLETTALIQVVVLFTLLNIFIKPILKVVLSPFILITMGLGIIVINALLLYVLTWISDTVMITGLYPLVYATLIIGIINMLIHMVARPWYKKRG